MTPLDEGEVTPLAEKLREQIRLHGPVDVSVFMTLAMAHREHGYYSTRDPLGRAGDFITAPEISQLFGELVGVWLANCWLETGEPSRVMLVEIGPGRGTLLRDALRATRKLPGFHDALELHLVETSPALRAVQEKALDRRCHWHDSIAELPGGAPILLVANELLDVLPIHQLQCTETGMRERCVGLDDRDQLAFVLDPRSVPAPEGRGKGEIVELSPTREAMVREIAALLVREGGAGVLIDYGALDLDGADTLQAVRAHRPEEPLLAPGEADLSSHVAFRPLLDAALAEGVRAFGPVAQGEWLGRMGMGERLAVLAKGKEESVVEDLVGGARRLCDPAQMGELFKVVGLAASDAVPAGFLAGEEHR